MNALGGTSSSSVPLGDRYFHVFRQSCQFTRSSRIQAAALDGLQKQLAFGVLRGDCILEGDRKLIDDVIDTVCGCFVGEPTPDHVTLQIVKALLTAGTSPHVELHEATLLKAIRTCFNINLFCKNLVIQTTAKAALTQVINVVYARMEAHADPLEPVGSRGQLGIPPDAISANSAER